ncbi:MAG: short-chain fatty acid transporter [Bacillaceae bacterium]|nr:short-chain fatty acid transporter [Bacillaceae bacterium]
MKALTNGSVRLVSRYLPDPFLFAVILTLIVFFLGLFIGNTPGQMVQFWGDGFWNLLAFSMQMVLILVTGHTLANTPLFKRILNGIASLARTPGQAIMLTTVISAAAAWINWGFGLVIGALFARAIARQVERVDYRLLIASAYSGFIVWHAGLAGSIPLTIATEDHFTQDMIGIIPTSDTIFAPLNLTLVIVLVILLPIINRMMMPEPGREITFQRYDKLDDETPFFPRMATPADRMENSRVLSVLISIIGFWFILDYFARNGFQLNLNIVNLTFLFLGILLHGTPRRFLNAMTEAVKGTMGIIVQFPFYAGIMGMMVSSGLAGLISEWFVSISNTTTFPFFTFLSAGLVNIFVPSGGGQWAVQAPIMLPAGADLGVDPATTAMAVAWGDAWTNLIQPFWALPALGIAGLGARDIMGYCVVALLFSGVIISLGLLLL